MRKKKKKKAQIGLFYGLGFQNQKKLRIIFLLLLLVQNNAGLDITW